MVNAVAPSMGAVRSPKVRARPELLRSCNRASTAGENKGGQGWWEMTSARQERTRFAKAGESQENFGCYYKMGATGRL